MTTSPFRASILIVAATALIAAGCGGSDDDSGSSNSAADGSSSAATTAEGRSAKQGGKSDPLAENRELANQLIDGDVDALEERLAALEGHPVVVNQWASWCEPCRVELPFFADVANVLQKEVAFVGIDMNDSRSSAEQFLAEVPLPFPSIEDPNAAAIASLGGGVVSPTTVYIDASGEIVEVFAGSYQTRQQLEDAIAEHLGVKS